MTVRDLIQQLCALDPETPVVVYDKDWTIGQRGYRDAFLRSVKVAPKNNGVYPRFERLTDRNSVTAVCLE